ncbi:MAG: nucleotidyltransferase domain-containing protein [Chloroflexi bacterium]|nr:nucleotidyltransferase domain-containing protein [Chloroflexota bacterium]
MHFTVHHDPHINARVERDLTLIREALLERFPNITALILVGGFGRGEGSVLVDGTGNITPINDYDILVIHKGRIDRQALAQQRQILARRVGIWLLDLLALEGSEIPRLPLTQLHYDSSAGGYLFHGHPQVMDRWPRWQASDIPWAEGKKMLFNRFVSILEAYRNDFLHHPLQNEEVFKLANQTSKAILACCDALLILAGRYEHLYQKRAQRFAEVYPQRKTEAALVQRACDFKLRPAPVPAFDALSYWQEGMDFYAETLQEFLPRFYRRGFDDWRAFSRFYASPLSLQNWRGYARDLVRRLLGRFPTYGAILHLELAALHLIQAKHDTAAEHQLVRSARQHLQHSGCTLPSPEASWEEIRRAVVEHWYIIKH